MRRQALDPCGPEAAPNANGQRVNASGIHPPARRLPALTDRHRAGAHTKAFCRAETGTDSNTCGVQQPISQDPGIIRVMYPEKLCFASST